MFIREKPNPSGSVSVQIIDKSSGTYRVVKTVGSSSDPTQIRALRQQAKHELAKLTGQYTINSENRS